MAIPPYLLKNFYSRGLRILPVNESLDNIICNSADEAYTLVDAGFGYAMIPDFLLRKSSKTVVVNWQESPHAPFGIYYQPIKSTTSNLKVFVELIREHFKKSRLMILKINRLFY